MREERGPDVAINAPKIFSRTSFSGSHGLSQSLDKADRKPALDAAGGQAWEAGCSEARPRPGVASWSLGVGSQEGGERGWVGSGQGGRGGEGQGQRERQRRCGVRVPPPTPRLGPAVPRVRTGGGPVSAHVTGVRPRAGTANPPCSSEAFSPTPDAYLSLRKARVGGVGKSYFVHAISECFEYPPVGLGGTGGERSFPLSAMVLASFPLSRLQLLGVGVAAGRQQHS